MNNLAHSVEESGDLSLKMGRMLVESGKITSADLRAIIDLQNERGLRFGDAAIALGLVSQADIRAVLAQQFAYPHIPDQTSRLHPSLTAAFRPESKEIEALRGLRSELMLRYFNSAPNLSLTLTSADDAPGVARTAANLAIVFAQMGLRTLLIDTNLREPQMHHLFGTGNRHPGLAELIAGRARSHPLPIPSLGPLWLLHAGTQAPNPQELLSSRNYRERMSELFSLFDVTLISTSPMNDTRDAQLVAAHSGAALLVTREHASRMKDVEKMCSHLWGVGVRLLGVALRQ